MFLFNGNEWQGQTIDILVPAAHKLGHSAQVSAFLQSPVDRPMGTGADLTAQRRDGTEFPVEIGLRPLPTREGAWVIAAIVDLTGRKLLESTIRAQHERLQASWEAASEGLITVDESGAIEMVNQATERIFGYPRSELLGQPLEILIPQAHRVAHAEKRERYTAEPALRPMGAGMDLYGRRKDGTEFPAEVGLNSARVGGRRIIISFISDITEKRRLEEQSAVLGTLVDLQQQLATSKLSRIDAADSDFDPLTGVGTPALFDRALREAS